MLEFFRAVATYPFMQYLLLAGVLSSVACGVVGTYVVVRRITYIAGGIAHSVLAGLGAAYYLNREHGLTWLHPMHGAVVAALVAAGVIGWVGLRARQREDTVIGAIWAVGMAVGLLFIHMTRGYYEDLMSYLFGSIQMVRPQDLWLIVGLDVLVVGVGVLFYNQLLAVCLDETFARTRGVRVELYYMILLGLTALTVVLLARVVGLVLMIALLTLPVAVAGQFVRRLWQMMVASAALCIVFTVAGMALSWDRSLPTGAAIVVLAGGAYLVAPVAAGVWRRLARRRRDAA